MKKLIMILTLVVSMNCVPVFGAYMSDNSLDIRDTFRMYIVNPVKI